MSREDEMRELVKKLAGDHANRHQLLEALSQEVQQVRVDAAVMVSDVAAARARMSNELHAGLADDLAGRRDAVQAMLGTFSAERQSMAAEMDVSLAATRHERQNDVDALRNDARQYIGQVAKTRQAMAADLSSALAHAHAVLHLDVQTMLGGFSSDRAAMSLQLSNLLTAEHKARQQDVSQTVTEITAMLDRFAAEHRATAAELHQSLSDNMAARQREVADMRAEIRVMLHRFSAENRAAATELHAYLNADRAARSSEVAAFMAETLSERQAMAKDLAAHLDHFMTSLGAEVSGTLAGFAEERRDLHASLAEMATVWQEYKAGKWNGEAATAAPPQEPEPVAPSPSEEAMARILKCLSSLPEGAKLVELEPMLDIPRPTLGKYLRHLVDSGQVVKDPETLVYKLA